MKIITTTNAPAAVGPYSTAIEVNGFVFCSGQIGIDPSTGNLVDGLEAQAHQVMNNIKAVVESTGVTVEQIIKTTIFVTNMADYAKVNEIYAQHLGEHKPARSTVAVAALPKGALIEIEVIVEK